MGLAKEVVATLAKQDEKTLASWWKELNRWGWVTELGDPEDKQDYESGRRTAIMAWIENEIGFKECLRAWNSERMDNEAFERFWANGPGKRFRPDDAILDAEEIE